MTESMNPLYIIRTDTTTKQEGSLTIIGIEDIPVELLAIASHGFAFGIEEETIDESFVGLCL